MANQLNPLQFVELQINLLERFNRTLELTLVDMGHKGHVALATLDTMDSWRCLWVMGSAYHTYRGQASEPHGAVLACLEKAREGLNNG